MTLASASLLQQLRITAISPFPSVTGLHRPITLRSLGWFFYSLAWVWALLISSTGWGRFAATLARIRRVPASIACGIGIAVLIFLGGLLNLLHAIYAGALFALVGIGLLLYVWLRKHTPQGYRWSSFWARSNATARVLCIAALLILAYRVAGTVRLAQFNVTDDSAAYLSLPRKMLSMHHFVADPFSERRNTSSLGGSYLLQDLVLSATTLPNVGMADRAEGLMLLAAVVFDLGILFELSMAQISLLLLLVFLVPQQTFNLTFIVLPVPLLLAMIWLSFRAQSEDTETPLQYALLAGIVGGAAISLKSTYLPVVGALSVIPYLASIRRSRLAQVLKLVLSAIAGIVVVLAFWMIALKLTTGTYLFPLLGRGLDYSARGLFPSVVKFPTTRSLLKVFIQGSALLVLALIQLSQASKTRYSRFSISVLLSTALAVTALNYASSADSIWRYNFPQFFAAIVVFYVSAVATRNHFPRSTSVLFVRTVAVAAMLAMILYYDLAGRRPEPFQEIAHEAASWQAISAGVSGQTLTSRDLREEYQLAESSMPANGAALEDTAYSFLFNYRSRPIYLMGWAGASAPAPGWPFGANSSQLRSYLQGGSIRYVVLDIRYTHKLDAIMCQDLQTPERFSEWLQQQLWMNILANLQMDSLTGRYQSIYNDGSMTVLDLTKPLPGASAEPPSWRLDSSLGAVCSHVARQYSANWAGGSIPN